MKTIGFVGLGSMGLPMAINLGKAGFAVTGFDLRAEARTVLQAAGGEAAGSLADAFSGRDAVVLMVVNATQAEDILFGQGALTQLAPGGTVILMATCPPAAVAALAARVEAAGHALVDAPVSGGVVGAEAGSLTIMAAARRPVFDAVKPVLDAMGSKVVFMGEEPGQGATAKAVNQLLCGAHLAIAAEALSLAEKLGVDTHAMLDIVSGSAASSWMLRDRGARMLEREPRVTSAVDIFVKDLGIVLEAGRDAKAALPMAALAHQLFLSVSGRGLGARDDSQVIAAYRAMQGRDAT
ncbi:NAD(P)-dependent oxidoreductase [Bosea sp. (in: a-proteobacteria)]|jgi:3-hydroxyisobutyrate dehydrogenase|uniref:NAD(P)-dependent oxidoreductase n=1 Tax=Bosea sp. (in: a-proteobacteria) TaxID=1871050 RepID=UPI002DDD3B06|nr:NAD(P)-dependent oxidoreductase [Bosea sp. (in: a-proteobacteria)]HEV2508319.1 NAD(P)-dependent oxidoreductase [Bosea sp. (in: a-proteobacteria)]